MKPNRARSYPHRLLFIDTESRAEQVNEFEEHHRLWFGWCCYERRRGTRWSAPRWFRFSTADEAWEIIERHAHSKERLWVFAHNLGFDAAMISLETQIVRRNWEVKSWAYRDHLLFIHIRKGNRTIFLCDTLNYSKVSLAEIARAVGMEKLPMPSPDASQEEWDEYCRRDVEIVRAFVHLLIESTQTHDWGKFQPTLPAMAFNAWRHRFMRERPLVVADEDLSTLERSAYYGGRVECFRLGHVEGKIYRLDINSSYPFQMRYHPFPLEVVERGRAMDIHRWQSIKRDWLIIAECAIETNVPIYPKRIGRKLVFPVGRFWTTLCTPELNEALRRGHLRAIGRYAIYKPAYLFRDYVEELYQLRMKYRREGNRAFEWMMKLMMNSLYGKFGQKAFRWEECHDDFINPPREFYARCLGADDVLHHVVLFGKVYHRISEGEGVESIPAIAAHVTAYGRKHLWQLMEKAGLEHVVYVDTDSLFVDEVGFRRLQGDVDASMLGKLKLEGETDHLVLHGLKDYEFGEETKIKGVRKSARALGASVYIQDQFAGYSTMLRSIGDGVVSVKKVIKRLRRKYEKGIPDAEGRVHPIVLYEW